MVIVGFSLLGADECDDIAFEENFIPQYEEEECEQGRRCRYPMQRPNPMEEHIWRERSDASWPNKRDDNIIDQFLHQ